MNCFSATCQGESHKATGKPCQDCSWSGSWDGGSMAIVCDGHGGARYFRSDIGSKLCVEITSETVKQFVSIVDKTIFAGKHFTQRKAIYEMSYADKLRSSDEALRQLFSSIIVRWRDSIAEHAQNVPLSQWEERHIEAKYLDDFKCQYNLEKIYGCTLMTYVQTPDYWFAFQIGDGKCVAFNIEDELWCEPIPWDDRCFLNKTTSICDSDALSEFRYCYCGDGKFPAAIFLGSDGMDDSFGPMENLVDFYIQILKQIATVPESEVNKDIIETLPILSKRGSQDDMSLAYIWDKNMINVVRDKLVRFQINRLLKDIKDTEEQIKEENTLIQKLTLSDLQKDVIEREYAIKKVESLSKKLVNSKMFLEKRMGELGFTKVKPNSRHRLVKINRLIKKFKKNLRINKYGI